jgi:hypothetical protein
MTLSKRKYTKPAKRRSKFPVPPNPPKEIEKYQKIQPTRNNNKKERERVIEYTRKPLREKLAKKGKNNKQHTKEKATDRTTQPNPTSTSK